MPETVDRYVSEFVVRDINTVSQTRKIAENAKAAAGEVRNLRLQTQQSRLQTQRARELTARSSASTAALRAETQQNRLLAQQVRLREQLARAAARQARAEQTARSSSGGRGGGLFQLSGGLSLSGGPVGGFVGVGGAGGAVLGGIVTGITLAVQAALALAKAVGEVTVGIAKMVAAGTVGLFQLGAKFDGLNRGLIAVTGGQAQATARMRELRAVAALPGLNLEGSIRNDTRLLAAQLNPRLALRTQAAFGNAVATVGGGPEELQGVVLAISQIASKGKVFAEEINQINERVPQIRKAMKDAFGTSNTEELGKMGIGAEEFLSKVVTQLEKLPRVTGGATNALENLKDSATIGLLPLASSIARGFEAIVPTITRIGSSLEPVVVSMGRVVDATARSGALAQSIERAFGGVSKSLKELNGDTLTGGLVTAASYLLATFANLPLIISQSVAMVKDLVAPIVRIYEFIQTINRTLNPFQLAQDAIGKHLWFWDQLAGGPQRRAESGQMAPGERVQSVIGKIAEDAAKLRAQVTPYLRETGTVSGAGQVATATAASPTTPMGRLVESNERIARATEAQVQITSQMIGGGSLAQTGLPIIDILGKRMGGMESAGRGPINVNIRGAGRLEDIFQDIAEQIYGGIVRRGFALPDL